MDKKSNHYSRQGSNKTQQSSEVSRKSSGGSNLCSSKQWPRNARRRENPNQSNSKQDPARSGKGQPAKNRPNVDKRPKPRGFGNSSNDSSTSLRLSASSPGLALEGAASTEDGGATLGDDLLEAELNSIYLPGSKKQNLNHLLNFHYVSRDCDNASGGKFNVFNGNRTNNRGGVTRRHKYNKEQFLQANFQFVLKSEENIQQNIASPDTLVDWNLIEQINIQTTEEPQCPICLYPPIAAKLTRCGHAYCWPCILHYLALSDKTWRKCPICYDAVHIGDLKSTSIVQLQNWKVGDTISMQLMRRPKASMFIEQVDGVEVCCESIPHLRDNYAMRKFAKFLLADSDEIQSIIEREKQELLLAHDVDTPESVFVQQALDLLEERKGKIVVTNEGLRESTKSQPVASEMVDEEVIEVGEQLTEMSLMEQRSTDSSDLGDVSVKNSTNGDSKYHYFYQSSDGQNIYLHAMNVRILQAMYGSFDKCPTIIEGKILEKHSHSMDQEFRKKLRYLQHLPLTCQFEVVELQFEPPTVSPEVLERFKDEIDLRRRTRKRRAQEERRRERQINEINERQMGKIISRSANIDINSSQQFPSCGFDDSPTGISIGDFPQSLGSDLSTSPLSVRRSGNSTSFAEMLSSPKRELWPSLGPSGGGDQISTAGAWGKPAASSSAIKASASSRQINRILETDSLEELDVSTLQHSLGDVIIEALQQKQTDPIKTNAGSAANAGGKKNKKNKKMLLFSTGINHKGN
ncbi:RING finger protein 10 isoform X2 [Hermetia illucens]|uniref:RING finger protein 10 isoform X2 n=1 Tax=Hermetia illucens TaxID=343691 RepID=UPI0018CC606F|nr:RING finger protein 10 isoform X2 [Hermetia illucens]